MKKVQTKKSFFQDIEDKYYAQLKDLKRKKFLLKARLFLIVVLPVFIILLATKVIQTFVRIKLRSIFTKQTELQEQTAKAPSKPVPAVMTPVEKEFIKPVPCEDRPDQ